MLDIEGDCMFVARLENSDENLLNKVVHNADEAYALYNDYALQMGLEFEKVSLDIIMGQRT